MKKRIIYAAMALLSLALISCERENIKTSRGSNAAGTIGITVSDISGIVTKVDASPELIASDIIKDFDGDEDIRIEAFVSDFSELPFAEGPETKGSIVTSSDLNKDGGSFTVNAWLGKENRFPNDIATYEEGGSEGRVNYAADETNHRFITDGTASYDSSKEGLKWTLADASGNEYIWRNDVPTTFWSYYPSGIGSEISWPSATAEDGSAGTTDTQNKITFTHTVASTAASQVDAIFAFNRQRAAFEIDPHDSEYGKLINSTTDIVSIVFYHSLSAIRFDISGLKKLGCTVQEIYFKNVASQGTCTVTGADNKPSFSWNTTAKADSVKQAFSDSDFTEKSLDGKTEAALQTKTSSKYFFLIPQAIKDQNVLIGIKYTDHLGATQVRTFKLDHSQAWEAGKLYTYKLSPAELVDVDVIETVTVNSKSDVKIQNTGNVDEFLRAAIVGNWVVKSGNAEILVKPWTFNATDFEGMNTTDWTYNSTDGYFYSKNAVESGEELDLFDEYVAPGAPIDGATLNLYIMSQAVAAGSASSWAAAVAATTNN